jgi:hypothetical protein
LASEKYFGKSNDPDSIGCAKQLVKGINAFSNLYDQGEDLAKGNITLIMKSIYHCQDDVIVSSEVPKDKEINMAILTSKSLNNRVQITPRAVWDFGKQVEKNGKKALAIVKGSEYRFGKLPSGKKYEDYLLFLREQMYKGVAVETRSKFSKFYLPQIDHESGSQSLKFSIVPSGCQMYILHLFSSIPDIGRNEFPSY